jgi:hypothetical protein
MYTDIASSSLRELDAVALATNATVFMERDTNMQINVYRDADKSLWDDFVLKSKNGTFLFLRDYMDYHRDRFADHSLLVFDEKERLIALLPANKDQDTLVSHGGLTYGGFVTDEQMRAALMLQVFEHSMAFLREQGFQEILYKRVPYIYHRLPAEEDAYALFLCGGVLSRRDVTTVVIPGEEVRFQQRRSRAIKKAQAAGVTCGPCEDYQQYWQLVEDNLRTAHQAKPVHTVSEIQRLHSSFPDNIKLFCAFLDTEMLAGTVIYQSQKVAHTQYIASSEIGRSCGALDLLFFYLLREVYQDANYFDFGTSMDPDGGHLNKGLVEYKEGFGGRSIAHDFCEIKLV